MQSIETLLASKDLARPRTPDELAALEAEIEQEFVASQELKLEARGKKGLWKKYDEEVRPLGFLARRLFAHCRNVTCEPNFHDNGNHDAVISYALDNGRATVFVEFTCAKDGYEEYSE